MNALKTYLPPLMKTTYWNAFMDSVEEVIKEIQETKFSTIQDIYSLSDAGKDDLFQLANTMFRLNILELENIYRFLQEIESIQSDDEEYINMRALERIRQELLKIPYSMDKRGMLQFYYSIFEFLEFNYPGIISLIKTVNEDRIAPIVSELSLSPYDDDRTMFITPTVTGDFSGTEKIVYDTLDHLTGEEGEEAYTTLDSGTNDLNIPTLDRQGELSLIAYRKVVLIGLLFTGITARYFLDSEKEVGSGDGETFYPGAPIFPEELGRFYQTFLGLNKRSTDVLIFGPMLALNITTNLSDIVPRTKSILITKNATSTQGYTDHYMLLYYTRKSIVTGEESPYDEPFYEEKILNYSYTPLVENEGEVVTPESLVVLGFCQGEYDRHYIDTVETDADHSYYRISIPKEDWTDEVSIRLHRKADSSVSTESQIFLFYKNQFGEVIQRGSTESIQLKASVEEGDTDVSITFQPMEGDLSSYSINEAVYLSHKLHTKVNKIELVGCNSSGEKKLLATVEFPYNTQVELCKGITLTTYLSVRLTGDPQTRTLSEEAIL